MVKQTNPQLSGVLTTLWKYSTSAKNHSKVFYTCELNNTLCRTLFSKKFLKPIYKQYSVHYLKKQKFRNNFNIQP